MKAKPYPNTSNNIEQYPLADFVPDPGHVPWTTCVLLYTFQPESDFQAYFALPSIFPDYLRKHPGLTDM